MDGILAVDKPAGWTSHDVVAVCRGVSAGAKTGHGGTLDPLASGVLPIVFGRATRFVERLHTATKVYGAAIAFGSETTTDDREGPVTITAPPPSGAEIEHALARFRGDIEQVPPDYAAVKVGGRPAYARARAGETLQLAARPVRIDRFEVARWDPPVLRCLVVCSSGTYIRSLARDVGRAAGSAAHLGALVRLAVGSLELEHAMPIAAVRALGPADLAALLALPDDRVLALPERFRSEPADRLLLAWEG